MYRLEKEQIIPTTIEKAWDFFSNPQNLNRLTPDNMGFETVGQPQDSMHEGMLIQYKVKVLPLVKMNWTSLISTVVPKEYFVDEQVQGPFAYWNHEHHFLEKNGGVEVRDILQYKVPMGWLGKLFHPIIVEKKLTEIFQYRYKKMNEIFDKA